MLNTVIILKLLGQKVVAAHLDGGTQAGVFENGVLRRIFGPKWDEVTGEWRKLHNEELNDLYSSHNIVRVIN